MRIALDDPRVLRHWWLAPVAAAAVLLTACSSSVPAGAPEFSASSGGSAVATSGSGAPAADLSGVTLNVGDQASTLQSQLQASGQLDDLPYKISWSQFQGGPTVIAAETGGSVDVGFMAETPVVFAQASNSPVKVVAVSRISDTTKSNFALLVKKDSPIKTLADLKGKKIIDSPGTVAQYLVAKVLEKAGLSTKDVHLVNLQQGGQAAYDRGDVDVEPTGGAPLVLQLAKGEDRVLATGTDLLPGVNYIVARSAALEDPTLSAAIGDFVSRLAKAQQWYNANPDKAAEIVAPIYKVDAAAAKAIVTQAPFEYIPIDEQIKSDYQDEADFFAVQGLLKAKIDGSAEFDDRYNSEVAAAAGTSP